MLATLDISKAVDDLGNIVEPTVNYNNAVFRYVVSWHKYFGHYGLTNLFFIITDCLINLNAICDRAPRKLFLLLANLSSLHEFFLSCHSVTIASRRILHLNHDLSFCAPPLLYPLVFFSLLRLLVCFGYLTLNTQPNNLPRVNFVPQGSYSYLLFSLAFFFFPRYKFETPQNSLSVPDAITLFFPLLQL